MIVVKHKTLRKLMLAVKELGIVHYVGNDDLPTILLTAEDRFGLTEAEQDHEMFWSYAISMINEEQNKVTI